MKRAEHAKKPATRGGPLSSVHPRWGCPACAPGPRPHLPGCVLRSQTRPRDPHPPLPLPGPPLPGQTHIGGRQRGGLRRRHHVHLCRRAEALRARRAGHCHAGGLQRVPQRGAAGAGRGGRSGASYGRATRGGMLGSAMGGQAGSQAGRQGAKEHATRSAPARAHAHMQARAGVARRMALPHVQLRSLSPPACDTVRLGGSACGRGMTKGNWYAPGCKEHGGWAGECAAGERLGSVWLAAIRGRRQSRHRPEPLCRVAGAEGHPPGPEPGRDRGDKRAALSV